MGKKKPTGKAVTIIPDKELAALAVRIKCEHEEVRKGLMSSVIHAIKAGEALSKAKEKVKHGEWSRWIHNNCELSERTAQLYMRMAAKRTAIEEGQNRNGVAEMSLRGAIAVMTNQRAGTVKHNGSGKPPTSESPISPTEP